MAKKTAVSELVVLPVAGHPFGKDVEIAISDDDERLLTFSFLRLAQLTHVLRWREAEDVLLLLTTCRNEWYAVNAMYVEARKWCDEGKQANFKGYGDALDEFRACLASVTNGSSGGIQNIHKAASAAGAVLQVVASYLTEFEKKRDLYFDRFESIHQKLLEYAKSLDPIAQNEFETAFTQLGSGPGPHHSLRGPTEPEKDMYLTRLMEWVSVVRPLTGLTRTYISNVVGVGKKHEKPCAYYAAQLEVGVSAWINRGIDCPAIPASEVFESQLALTEESPQESSERIGQFLDFCQVMCTRARRFLLEMLPAHKDRSERFPLKKPTDESRINIAGREFERRSEMFVLITDMRNSVGDRHRSPELKIRVDEVINALRKEKTARSQTTYDDCRVVACDSLDAIAACARRLFSALEIEKSDDGFAGLRMGCARGEMLFEYDGLMTDLLRAAPMDSSDISIARAARLMSFDTLRWNEEGQALHNALGDLGENSSLLFIDASVYQDLPEHLRSRCRSLDLVQLKGVGPRMCWAIPITEFAV